MKVREIPCAEAKVSSKRSDQQTLVRQIVSETCKRIDKEDTLVKQVSERLRETEQVKLAQAKTLLDTRDKNRQLQEELAGLKEDVENAKVCAFVAGVWE